MLSLPIAQRRTTLARLMEEVLVLVATLVGELPHHLHGSRQSCLIDAQGCHDLVGVGKPEVMTDSKQLAHALVYQVTICQSSHGPCASLLGVLV
jgi:hypothetical protein